MATLQTRPPAEAQIEMLDQAHRRRWWILAVLCLCLFLTSVDSSIVNVALPALALHLSATASELQWVSEAYTLVLAGLVLTCGVLTDRFGSQRTLLTGLAVFGGASVAAAFAPNALFLIVARAVMGVGGALIMPATLSTVKNVFRPDERPRAIAIWASIASFGIVIGPLAGGWLLEHFWWGAAFLINVPIVLITLVATFWLMPNLQFKQNAARLDYLGTLLSIAGIGGLVFGVIEGPSLGWSNPLIWLSLGGGLVLLAGFVAWEFHTDQPMLNLRLFRNPRFSAASGSGALAYFALFGALFSLTQYFQFVLGYTPLEAGLHLLPLAISVTVAGLLGSFLMKWVGTRWLMAGGLALVAAGLFVYSTVTATTGYGLIVVMLILISLGLGVAATVASDSIMSAVPQTESGAGAAVDETAIELGGALGVAVLGSVLSAGYTSAMSGAVGLPAELKATVSESIGAAFRVAQEVGGPTAQTILHQADAAFVSGMSTASLLGAGLTLVGALIALVFLPGNKPEPSHSEGK